MRLRPYIASRDYEYLQKWVNDERTHALWCANMIPYPMTYEKFQEVLEKDSYDWGGCAFVATEDVILVQDLWKIAMQRKHLYIRMNRGEGVT